MAADQGRADAALERLSPEFDRVYASVGRASAPPERLLKASLLIALYSVRSERAFCKRLAYNLPCRWFPGLDLPERSFDATVFTKNRARLLAHDADQALFNEVVWTADQELPAAERRGHVRQFRIRRLKSLCPRVQATEVAFPIQNPAVGRYELVVAQGGSRDDDAIGRIAVKVGQVGGFDPNLAIDRDLVEPVLEQPGPQGSGVGHGVQPSLRLQHGDFPERNRRHRHLAVRPGIVDRAPGVVTQPAVVGRQPHQCVRVKDQHAFVRQCGSSTWSGLDSASHSTSIGDSTSPTCRNRCLKQPKGARLRG